MRSLLLVAGSFILVVALYLGYSALQSGSSHTLKKSSADPLPAPPTKGQPWTLIKPGHGVWVSAYDENGILKNRFKSDEYQPQPNGKIHVTNPVAEFYMAHNQMMRLIGKTGEVSMPPSSPTAGGSPAQFVSGSPNRGQIEDVTIQLFNMLPGALPDVPDETITTRNIQFDNATRLITTETEDGIPADQIPVHMRSDPDHLRPDSDHRGYDFDGRGMRLRWNDKDGRLDLLEIAHGEQLIVKDTSSVSGSFGGGAKSSAPAGASADARKTGTPNAALVDTNAHAETHLATYDTSAPSSAANPPATSHAPAGNNAPPIPVPYLATFYDNVRITQGDEALVTADKMDVDFISRQEHQAPPTTAPSEKTGASGTSTTHQAPPDVNVETKANKVAAAATQPAAPQASAGPATRPASTPVVIRWTGKLVMMSAVKGRPKVAPGDAIVDLTGQPVMVRRTPAGQIEGDDVRAAKLIYHTADGGVKLINSPTLPQVVISKLINGKIDPQSTVTTGTLDYVTDAAGQKLAILTGAGHAMMPVDSKEHPPADPKAAAAMMDTHWKNGAKVFFLQKAGDDLLVDHIDLAGDVDVKHPQLALQSQALSLYFAAPAKPAPATQPSVGDADGAIVASSPISHPTTQPAKDKPQQELKRVLATDAVHCVMAGQNGKQQTIECNELEMLTARSDAGKFYSRQVNAGGAVHAFDPDQDLRADSIALTLKPAIVEPKIPATMPAEPSSAVALAQPPQTQPAKDESDTAPVELEKMIARDHVLVINKKDGSSANGSELVVTATPDHQNHVRLTGSPTAMVIDAKNNTVVGPVITFEQGVAHVLGAGKMHLLQEQQDGSKPRPMDVTWLKQADLNGPENRVDLTEGVAVTSLDADGTVNVAKGDLVHIDLVEKAKPATRPATAVASATTKPAKAGPADSMQMGMMKDKDVRTVTLSGNSQVVSTSTGDNGIIARQFALYGPKIIYQLADSKELPAKTLLVPSAGRMYTGDHRPPEKRKPEDKDKDDNDAGGRGDTAFQWSKRLVYSELQHQATLTGDVIVVHQPLGPQAEVDRVRVNADRVVALFEPQPKAAKPTTQPAPDAPATQPANPATALATTLPATRPTTRPADPGESLQLKHLTADGHVVIVKPSTGATLYSDRVDFDPIPHLMTARGSENNPARYVDPDPHRSLTGTEMQWNTETWNIKMTSVKTLNPK
ncbi:MAG TPA: hypothetical protein VFE47_13380 [Tepidisphaeraceae bacterium]|jgi:hypothetical protein|nr:hypothetical protein [Tepidisphaeraceae bacterium]